jgi:hypothetical protein
VEIDPRALERPPVVEREVQGGSRHVLTLREGAETLAVRAADVRAESSWTLALARVTVPEPLASAQAALEAYELDNARRLAEEGLDTLPAEWHAGLLGVLGRAAFLGGEPEAAQDHLRKTVALDREHGRLFDELRDSVVLVHALLNERRFTEARELLGGLAQDWGEPGEATCLVGYYRGLLALYTGDARGALRNLSASVGLAERLDVERLGRFSRQVLAEQYQKVGRRDRSEELLLELVEQASPDLPGCDRAQLLNNLAWNRLLALEAGEPQDDPTPILEEALGIFREECRDLLDERFTVLLNLSLAQLHAGRSSEARARLLEATTLRPRPQLRMVFWQRDIEARIALEDGRAQEAAARYEALAELAQATVSPEVAWRAVVGKAMALELKGNIQAARAIFADADARLDQESLQVPVHEGRETFLARRQWATRQQLQLLLSAGAHDEAFDLARRSRARALRSLRREERLAALSAQERRRWDSAMASFQAEREALAAATEGDWRLPADELRRLATERETSRRRLARSLDDAFAVLDRRKPAARQPAPLQGEALLLYHPLPDGWVGFAHDGRRVVARRLDCDPSTTAPERLASCLLAPFETQIDAAERVRILPYGALRAVDFHALAHDGDVLVSARPVLYGLDIGGQETGDPSPARQALIVADPRGDLPAAREEMTRVAASLAGDGRWEVRRLQGSDVEPRTLRRDLPRADLFHYAGHAEYAGFGGWDSALPLADSGHFTVGDILALERAPRWVVLSGCETARTSADEAPEGVGLAHAFLSNGAEIVLAAVRPVADTTAAALVDDFYASWTDGDGAELALQRAQLELRRDDPQADWSSFRIVVP